jgi:hypothetical protein
MVAEKRKYVRFLARPITHIELGSSFTKIGKIRNIRMGGWLLIISAAQKTRTGMIRR